MDTGLGAKAYAIIEQGKIGQILSSRPTDRRQLIEEAAGVTKYKARRRAAELKLEAAQQNLTRIDDIIFEVEKQRGGAQAAGGEGAAVQAAARRTAAVGEGAVRAALPRAGRRHRSGAAALAGRARARGRRGRGELAAVEEDLARTRIELAEAEARARPLREQAHARELEIDRRQNQVAFNRQQLDGLERAAREIADELAALEARREPARQALDERREAAARAAGEREDAAAVLARRTRPTRRPTAAGGARARRRGAPPGGLRGHQRRSPRSSTPSTAPWRAQQRVGEELARLEAERADVDLESARLHERGVLGAGAAVRGAGGARADAARKARRGRPSLPSARGARAAPAGHAGSRAGTRRASRRG